MRCKKTNRVALLVTITLPSKYHATRCKDGVVTRNPLYEPSLTPRFAADRLRREWAHVRARLARGGANAWGMHMLEPHHDGTPHMHALVYCCAEHERLVRSLVQDFGLRVEGRSDARILNVEHPHIYFAKCAKKQSVACVAWAWAWGIRISPVKFGDWSQAA
ncbi:replication endonuclease [Comamonas resistens]|uniref:replication endonuclease n=1 Tax=Comamonas resistens TaxID=3046670 RepID=UPI0039BC7C5F